MAWWLNQTSGSARDMVNGPHVTSPVWKGDASRFVPGTFRLSRQPTPSSMWSLINGDVLTRPESVGLGGLPKTRPKAAGVPGVHRVEGRRASSPPHRNLKQWFCEPRGRTRTAERWKGMS